MHLYNLYLKNFESVAIISFNDLTKSISPTQKTITDAEPVYYSSYDWIFLYFLP